MSKRLLEAGVEKVVPSLSAFPSDTLIDKQEIIDYVKENGVEGVLVTRLVDTRQEKVYHAPPREVFIQEHMGITPILDHIILTPMVTKVIIPIRLFSCWKQTCTW